MSADARGGIAAITLAVRSEALYRHNVDATGLLVTVVPSIHQDTNHFKSIFWLSVPTSEGTIC